MSYITYINYISSFLNGPKSCQKHPFYSILKIGKNLYFSKLKGIMFENIIEFSAEAGYIKKEKQGTKQDCFFHNLNPLCRMESLNYN